MASLALFIFIIVETSAPAASVGRNGNSNNRSSFSSRPSGHSPAACPGLRPSRNRILSLPVPLLPVDGHYRFVNSNARPVPASSDQSNSCSIRYNLRLCLCPVRLCSFRGRFQSGLHLRPSSIRGYTPPVCLRISCESESAVFVEPRP